MKFSEKPKVWSIILPDRGRDWHLIIKINWNSPIYVIMLMPKSSHTLIILQVGVTEKIADLRSKLLLLENEEFELAIKTLEKFLVKGPKDNRENGKLEPSEGLALYEEIRPATGELAVRGVPSV